MTLTSPDSTFFSSTFSGLRSQWMMRDSRSTAMASRIWDTNTLTRDRLSPRNLLCRMSSYRLRDSSSKARHRWLRYRKKSWAGAGCEDVGGG